MQVLVNTGSDVEGSNDLTEQVRGVVEDNLGRFSDRITRVEVHLNDENSAKGGSDDKRCMMEARLSGLDPTAVTSHSGSVREAINSAADKLERAIDSRLGRIRDSR